MNSIVDENSGATSYRQKTPKYSPCQARASG